MEHVRPDEILPLLRKVHRALKPGGRLVQQFFSLNLATAAAAGFRLSHSSEHDYRPTLRAWFDRLVAAKDEAVNLVGVQVTNKYLAFFASSWTFFDLKEVTLHRLVLNKD
jgi:cyclopropane-fatty-acyl-phospholipid synthase